MKHLDSLLAISLTLYTALLALTFFLGIFLWGGAVKAQPADFRHYPAPTSLQTMLPSYPDRHISNEPEWIEP